MLQKLSYLTTTDHSGAGWVQCFHLYRGSWRRWSGPGDYIKAAVKTVAFYPRYVKGKRYRPLRKGFIVRGLIVQCRGPVRFNDNSRHWLGANALVILKRRGVFKSKYLYGPATRAINRKQHFALFDAYL